MQTLRLAAASRAVNPSLNTLACSSFLWVPTGFRPTFLPRAVAGDSIRSPRMNGTVRYHKGQFFISPIRN